MSRARQCLYASILDQCIEHHKHSQLIKSQLRHENSERKRYDLTDNIVNNVGNMQCNNAAMHDVIGCDDIPAYLDSIKELIQYYDMYQNIQIDIYC